MAERILTGDRQLDAMLAELHRSSANRIARSSLGKGSRLAAKKIKREVPGHLKTVRKAIGSSVRKAKGGPNKGVTVAKAGAAVGKQRGKDAKRSTKHGVGMGPRNIHWWILGTNPRKHDSGHPTGAMPAHPVVQQALSTTADIDAAITEGARVAVLRELRKIKAKG